jgi:hypothetical protein
METTTYNSLVLAGRITVMFTSDIPVPIAPSFLPNLEYSERTLIGSAREALPAVTLTSLPGFTKLRQASEDLYVETTGFVDMSSLIGLRCPPFDTVSIANNNFLTSLRGLEGLTVSSTRVKVVTIVGNPLLKTSSAFAPLKFPCGCTGEGAGST